MTDRSDAEVTKPQTRDVDLPLNNELQEDAASHKDNVQQSRGAAAGNPLEFPRGATFPEALEAGRKVDRFELVRKLGKGGFGEVWECKDPQLERSVAIKFAKPHKNNSYNAADMLAEARKVSRLSHPNIVQIFDVLQDGSQIAIVSELIDGPTLRDRLEQGPIPIREVLSIVRDIAAGLQCAHQSNLVHRDVKPTNILLRCTGTALLTDFGLAASEVQLGEMESATSGTPQFMSPEQARGDLQLLDNRTDIFCVGIVLFHCLTGGKLPYPESKNNRKYVETVARRPPRTLRAVNGSLPRALDDICSRCLSMDPRDRYRSAQDLIDDIDAFLAQTDGEVTRPVAPPKFTRAAVIIAGVPGLLAAAVYISFFSYQPRGGLSDPEQLPPAAAPKPRLNSVSLSTPPEIFAWPFSDSRGIPEHTPEMQTYSFRSGRTRLIAICGRTDTRELDLSVNINLSESPITAGLFWGLAQNRSQAEPVEFLAYCAEIHRERPGDKIIFTLSELTFKPLDNQEMQIPFRKEVALIEAEAPTVKWPALEVRIKPQQLEVRLDGRVVFNSDSPMLDEKPWLPAGESAVGIIGQGDRVTFRNLKKL